MFAWQPAFMGWPDAKSYIDVSQGELFGNVLRPVAQAMLTYGQSTDPKSPWYADQTLMYSRKQGPVLPFAGLELGAVGWALAVSMRRNRYREVVSFGEERVRIEFGVADTTSAERHPTRLAIVEQGSYFSILKIKSREKTL